MFTHDDQAAMTPANAFSSARGSGPTRRRRLTALSLAAAVTCTLGALQITRLHADDGAPAVALQAEPSSGGPARLQEGLTQLREQKFEEAVSTLQSVDPDLLSSREQRTLTDALARAEAAAAERRNARADFQLGQTALSDREYAQALGHFRKAAGNRFADAGTRAKAREQAAYAEAELRNSLGEMKTAYDQAIRDFNAGDYEAARARFQQLDAAGFRAPLFGRSPASYLNDIDAKIGAAPSPASVAPAAPVEAPAPAAPVATVEPSAPAAPVTAPPAPAAAPPAPTPPAAPTEPAAIEAAPMEAAAPVEAAVAAAPDLSAQARDAYRVARDQLRQGDLASARTNFTIARDLGYRPGLFEVSPADYLARIDAQEQRAADDQARAAADAVAAAEQAAIDAQQAADAEASRAAEAAAREQADLEKAAEQAARADARNAYRLARDQYRAGDWASARQNFAIARDLGYRPGLFEDSPERYLARMDAREAATVAAAPVVEGAQPAEAPVIVQQVVVDSPAAAPSAAEVATPEPAPADLLGRVEQQMVARKQAIQYGFETAIEETRAGIEAADFGTAKAALERARVARNTDPGIFTPAEVREFDTVITNTQLALDKAMEKARVTEVQKMQDEAAQRLEDVRKRRDEERRRTVADLIRNTRQLVEQRKFEEALGTIDQILLLDPNNDYALGVRPLVEDRAIIQEQRRYREEFDRQFSRVLNQAEEARIPYSDIINYPANWPDISATRARTVEAERQIRGEDRVVAAQLERRLPEVRFDNVAFSEVIDFFRDVTGTNIFVNWRALETSGIDRTTPVTARLRDVKFAKALQTVIDDVGGGIVPLSYSIDDGVITVSTQEDLARNTIVQVYDIRDLIISIPDFEAPEVSFSVDLSASGGRGGGGGGLSFNLSGSPEEEEPPTREELVEQITTLVQDTVAPETWRTAGGTIGAISELYGNLIVTQTPENHRTLVALLDKLRETRAIMVTIEARFLFVQRNFLEDIGVDFDFSFNNSDPTDSNRRWSPISVNQQSASFNNPSTLATGVPGNLANIFAGDTIPAALSTGFTFIDDFSVSVLIRATQASENSSLLNAPRVTLYSGSEAYIRVGSVFTYVSDLNPQTNQGAVAFDPVPATGPQNLVQLGVAATVSADRKYVTLTLRPSLARLLGLDTFTVTQFAQQTTTTGGQAPVTIAEGSFQLPRYQIADLATTVSVPDGGTLLLGGQTLTGEIEREAGVPVLSKIPFLKRLFTNRSSSRDDAILLILVKPSIIIQREREQQQFPLLGSAADAGL